MVIKITRPYVILNAAVTADGKTDSVYREGAAISSVEDMKRVDRLRASVDAILVGGRTLLENDPRLTIKADELRKERIARGLHPNPVKVGVITQANIKSDSRFLTFGPAQVIIFTTSQTGFNEIQRLEALGARLFICGEVRVDLVVALQQLWDVGIRKVLVEGGGTLNSELLRLGLVDEISLYVAPVIFGGVEAPTFVDGQGADPGSAIRLSLIEVEQLAGGGIVLHYLPDYESEHQDP